MNPTIQTLILQITYLCLHISSQGKWHAFSRLSGHVRNFNVHVLDADTDYDGPHHHVLDQDVKYQCGRYDSPEDVQEIEQKAVTELQQVLAELERYLDLKQLGQQIVAQMESRREVLQ